MMTDDEFAAIEARATAATQGPLTMHGTGWESLRFLHDANGHEVALGPRERERDIALFARAREDLLALAAELRAERAQTKRDAYLADRAKARERSLTAALGHYRDRVDALVDALGELICVLGDVDDDALTAEQLETLARCRELHAASKRAPEGM